MLSARNAHPRDARVRFFDSHGQHEYCIYDASTHAPKDGNRGPGATYVSVTTLCHQGFAPFKAEQKAREIAASCRPGSYYSGVKAHEMTHTRWHYDPAKRRRVKHETGIWTYGRDAGTIMHECIEDFYNGKWSLETLAAAEEAGDNRFSARAQEHFRAFVREFPHLERFYNGRWTRAQLEQGTTSLLTPEMEHFLRFYDDHPHLVAFRTEWYVFDEALRLVGAIDMLFWDTRLQAYVIYDWKRARALRRRNWDGDTGHAWWSAHLPDANVEHYRLQLCIYALILERNYGIRVAEMWLVRLHPEGDNYEKVQVHWDEATMANLVATRLAQVHDKPEAPYAIANYHPSE